MILNCLFLFGFVSALFTCLVELLGFIWFVDLCC